MVEREQMKLDGVLIGYFQLGELGRERSSLETLLILRAIEGGRCIIIY